MTNRQSRKKAKQNRGANGRAAILTAILVASVLSFVPSVSADAVDEAKDLVGTPYCSSTLGCESAFLDGQAKCGSESHWEVSGTVVEGDADGGAHAYIACAGSEKAFCDIAPGGKACSSVENGLEAGAEGSLECDVKLEEGSEDANVDVECKDPPMPGKTGMLVKKLIGYHAETGSTVTLSETIEILPAL